MPCRHAITWARLTQAAGKWYTQSDDDKDEAVEMDRVAFSIFRRVSFYNKIERGYFLNKIERGHFSQ
jgi:hypothetical protein